MSPVRLPDLIGVRFKRLTVTEHAQRSKSGKAHFLCRCDCGAFVVADAHNLRIGHTTSCGCAKRDFCSALGTASRTHGQSLRGDGTRNATPLYRIWTHMIERCENTKSPHYERYGGRGICVCAEWRKNFSAFERDMGPRPAGKSIDRVNNDGNYEPSNCRWATAKEQANNRSSNRKKVLA